MISVLVPVLYRNFNLINKKEITMAITNETLQAKLEQAQKEAVEKAQQLILEARMKLLENPVYQKTLVDIEVNNIKTATLNEHIKLCEQIIIEEPVYNRATREERKWAGRYVFEFGNDIQLLYRLCTGILYSVSVHKDLMLAATGLDLMAIESFVTAMGSPAYYSPQYNKIIDPVPFDASKAVAYATVLGEQLGLALDTSKLTDANFTKYFNRELEKAEILKKEADLVPASPFTID